MVWVLYAKKCFQANGVVWGSAVAPFYPLQSPYSSSLSAMSACKTLARSSFSFLEFNLRINNGPSFSSLSLPHPLSIPSTNSSNFWFSSLSSRNRGFRDLGPYKPPSRSYGCVERAVIDCNDDETVTPNLVVEPPEDSSKDTVEELLSNKDDVSRLMKMERRSEVENGAQFTQPKRWFPYLNTFKAGGTVLSSGQVLEALNPHIMETRKERFRNAVKNRSYSVCLVVEGLNDFGNVSAAFRSADALGFQSVHVVSCDSSKRCTWFEVQRQSPC